MTKNFLLAFLLATLVASGASAQALRPSNQLGGFRAGTLVAAPDDGQRTADFIVAVVNSEPITNSEVVRRTLRTEQQLSQQGAALPPRQELMRQVLERLINERAQLQAARESGIKVDEATIDAAVQNVASQNQLSVPELRQRLAADNLPYQQFRDDLRDEILLSRVREREVNSRVRVTDQDLDNFIREQQNSTDTSALQLNLAQILISVPEGASPTLVASLQAKAQQVLQRAQSGADFTALVREYSDAPNAAATGGVLGLRDASQYPKLFVDATQGLRTGAISGLLRSDAGFHILKVIDKKQGGLPSAVVTQTHVRHILLRITPQMSEAAARAQLADMRRRILAGQADFAQLAREDSQDGSAKGGGDLGWANPGTFVPEFEDAMNALADGQISEPITSRFGVHLIQVLGRREKTLSQAEQRDLARGLVREKKQDEAYRAWAQEVRGRAYVEYREPPR